MKKIIFLLLFIYSTNVKAQYHPMLSPSPHWDVMHAMGTQICFYYSGEQYYIDGDTTLQGISYQVMKIHSVKSVLLNPWCGPYYVDTSSAATYTFLREDSAMQQIYRYSITDSSEHLLYDFSLQQGDTFVTSISGPALIDSTSTVVLANGSIRKILYLNEGNSYIESLGGANGPFDALLTGLGFWDVLLCTTDNGTLLWGGSCLPMTGVDENVPLRFQIYPDPASDFIKIEGSFKNSTITIHDLQGRIQLSARINTNAVDISHLQPGIYIYAVNDGNRSTSGKFSIVR
jgi:hypothetical protein